MPVYLQFGDIKGDVTEAAHVDWIGLTSAQFGTFRHEQGRPIGHDLTDITVSKGPDRATQPLMREALAGNPKPATIDFAREDGPVYMSVNMTGAAIASWHVTGSGPQATEWLTFNFTKVEFVKT